MCITFCIFSETILGLRTVFYHEFINWVGYDDWKDVKPLIRTSWDSSSNSFDKMYGLIKSFRRFGSRNEIITPPKKEEPKNEAPSKGDDDLDDANKAMQQAVKVLKAVYEYQKECTPTKNEYECFKNLFEYFSKKDENEIKRIISGYLKSKTEE